MVAMASTPHKRSKASAERISEDSTAAQVGGSLNFPALLGLIVAMIYTPLQAVRAGLRRRASLVESEQINRWLSEADA